MRALIVALLVALPFAVHADPTAPEGNLRIVFEIHGDKSGKDVRLSRYEVVSTREAKGAKATYRGVVAIPVPAADGVSSFSFQNVGFGTTLDVLPGPDGGYRLGGSFDVSGMDPEAPPRTPPWTIQRDFFVVLRMGQPLVVASADAPWLGPLRVSITIEKAD